MIFICIAYKNVYFAIRDISVGHHDSKEKLRRPDKILMQKAFQYFPIALYEGATTLA